MPRMPKQLESTLYRDRIHQSACCCPHVLQVKVDTLAYKVLMFANPFFSPGWTVMKAFRGSFTHTVAKDGASTAQ